MTHFTEFMTHFTEFSTCFTEFMVLAANTGPLAPTTALSQMRSGPQEQTRSAGMRGPWGYLATLSRVPVRVHLATLRHFDSLPSSLVKIDPLIPWERRLPKMEILEFQEVISGAHFGNRDYGRPFRVFLVTLRRFD